MDPCQKQVLNFRKKHPKLFLTCIFYAFFHSCHSSHGLHFSIFGAKNWNSVNFHDFYWNSEIFHDFFYRNSENFYDFLKLKCRVFSRFFSSQIKNWLTFPFTPHFFTKDSWVPIYLTFFRKVFSVLMKRCKFCWQLPFPEEVEKLVFTLKPLLFLRFCP